MLEAMGWHPSKPSIDAKILKSLAKIENGCLSCKWPTWWGCETALRLTACRSSTFIRKIQIGLEVGLARLGNNFRVDLRGVWRAFSEPQWVGLLRSLWRAQL